MSSLHLLGVLRFACRGNNFFRIATLVNLTTDLMKCAYKSYGTEITMN